MQTDNSNLKILPIKIHAHFIISILNIYYFKRRFGRIRNTIIKRWNPSLLCVPDVQWCPRIGQPPPPPRIPSAHPVNTQQTFVLVKTYWRHLQCNIFLSSKTSWRHNCKTSYKHVLKTSSRRLGRPFEDVLKTSWRRFKKTSWRVLKTF